MPRPPAHVPPPPTRGPSAGLIGGVVALVVALIAVLVYVAVRPDPVDTRNDAADITGGGTSPNALPNAGGVRVGDAGEDAPDVRVYVDYQCPWCGLLESVSGPAMTEAAQDGDIRLTFTLMSFLDRNAERGASLRSANAALCADDQGAFVEFHETLFAGQPEEEGEGWTDAQLVGFGEAAGVDDIDAFTGCLADGTHFDYVRDMQTRANQDGVSGSPRVFVNGTELGREQMDTLMRDPNSFPAVLQSAL